MDQLPVLNIPACHFTCFVSVQDGYTPLHAIIRSERLSEKIGGNMTNRLVKKGAEIDRRVDRLKARLIVTSLTAAAVDKLSWQYTRKSTV